MAYQHIFVPVDGSATSFSAIQQAADFAKAFNAKVTVVQVLSLDPYIAAEYISAQQTNEIIERARRSIVQSLAEAKQKFAEHGVEVTTQLLEGQVVHRELVKAAQDQQADLIIIGSHGRTGLKKFFLGSVAQNVLAESTMPVLVVRQA